MVAIATTWSQPVAEEVVFSNYLASRRQRPRRPCATFTRQAWRMGRNTGCSSAQPTRRTSTPCLRLSFAAAPAVSPRSMSTGSNSAHCESVRWLGYAMPGTVTATSRAPIGAHSATSIGRDVRRGRHTSVGLCRHTCMQNRNRFVVTAALAVSAAFVGGWAQFAPRQFYTSFPLPGRHWVSMLGDYNEHLIRDVGSLYLALLAISVWALLRPHEESFLLVGLAWLVFSVPHLIFHLAHLDRFGTADRVGNLVTLGGTVVLAALLMIPSRHAQGS